MTSITIPEGATIQESTRKVYTIGAAPTASVPIPFPYFASTDISVYEDGVLQTETTDYTISGTAVDGGFSSGTVTFVPGTLTNVEIIVARAVPVERLSDFSASGQFPMAQLNLTLDKLFAIEQQLRTSIARAVRLADTDVTEEVILPSVAARAGKYLYFDPVTGDPAAAQNLTVGAAVISGFITSSGFLNAVSAAAAAADISVPTLADLAATDASIVANETGRLLDMQVFTTPGANTWTKPAGTKSVQVICIGGGGGGGGCLAGASPGAAVGGGGLGGCGAISYITSGIGATETVTIGAGGAGGATGANNGIAGSNTLFGAHVIAVGGTRGSGSAINFGSFAGNNFTGTTGVGDVTFPPDLASPGTAMYQTTGTLRFAFGSSGSSSALGYGSGGEGGDVRSGASGGLADDGSPGVIYGGGGGGGAAINGITAAGGAGAAGICIVKSYG